jgi:hypothetical protein
MKYVDGLSPIHIKAGGEGPQDIMRVVTQGEGAYAIRK